MTLFIVSVFVFIISILGLTVFLSMWVYKDAQVKSEQEPSLWVLAVLFLQGIGILVYFLVGRTKKDVPAPGTYKVPLILSIIGVVAATVVFVFGTIHFARGDWDFGPHATFNSGIWSGRTTSYRSNRWTESARSGKGTSRRTHTLNAEQLRNFHVDSTNEEGSLYLLLEQGQNFSRVDITGDFYETINLLDDHGFEPGRIRITLQYERVRNSYTIINWRVSGTN